LERIILNLKRQELGPEPPSPPDAFLAVADEMAQGRSLTLARELRKAGATVITGAAGRSLKSQMRQANALGARYALVLGEKELAEGTVSVRDLTAATQESVPAAEVVKRIRR
jgi:histidyl-tRNA synthetase